MGRVDASFGGTTGTGYGGDRHGDRPAEVEASSIYGASYAEAVVTDAVGGGGGGGGVAGSADSVSSFGSTPLASALSPMGGNPGATPLPRRSTGRAGDERDDAEKGRDWGKGESDGEGGGEARLPGSAGAAQGWFARMSSGGGGSGVGGAVSGQKRNPALSVAAMGIRPGTLLLCFVVGLTAGLLWLDGAHKGVWPLLSDLHPAQCSAYHRVDARTGEETGGGVRPLLIIVTPTYVRPFQAMYLHRLANLLAQVPPPVLWLVVEIFPQSAETAALLRGTGLVYRHLVAHKNMTDIKDRGVHQRNAAMEHVEKHRLDGIMYFADDDNIYSLELFEEMRAIKRFGTWPVAMLQQGKSRATLEGPVCEGGRVIGWHTNEKSRRVRRFHVDMCGFAFNSTILWNPSLWRRPTDQPIRQLDSVKEGFQETTFIEQLVADESQMEALADDCSRVLVWHVHLEAPRISPFPHWSAPLVLPPILSARVPPAVVAAGGNVAGGSGDGGTAGLSE
ncbi:unnamed protein product [Closterium sp. Yama58-4]|nr:unnamed protein product [Closterium sp. Yama58-4]